MRGVSTFRESVVMLIDGFLAVTAVLDPHRLFLPAAFPGSESPAPPSVVAGDALLPAGVKKKRKKLTIKRMGDLISIEHNIHNIDRKIIASSLLESKNPIDELISLLDQLICRIYKCNFKFFEGYGLRNKYHLLGNKPVHHKNREAWDYTLFFKLCRPKCSDI